MSRRIAAEYSDEVSKLNKKEDLLLQRKLRVFDKQERAAETVHKRSLQNVQQFKLSLETDKRTPNLKDLERERELSSDRQYGGVPIANSTPRKVGLLGKSRNNGQEKPAGRAVRLPPLYNRGSMGHSLKQTVFQPPVTLLKSPRFKSRHRRVPDYSLQLRKLEGIVKAMEDKQNPLGINHLFTGDIPTSRPLGGSKEDMATGVDTVSTGDVGDAPVAPPEVEEGELELPGGQNSRANTEEWVDASLKEKHLESPSHRNTSKTVLASKDDILTGRRGTQLANKAHRSGFVKEGELVVIRPHSANTCCAEKRDLTGNV